ncbi:MAG: ECF-type sigma factor [Steroidobacteraceae bacterium]
MTEESKSDAGGDVTQLLKRWSEGNNESLDPLFNMVYPRLRQIANALFRGESPESMLQPTGVVNELFIKLVRQHSLRFDNREHFFSLAASLMRRILIDHARAENRDKRDGGVKVPMHEALVWVSTIPSADLLDIDRALEELQRIDPRKSRMVELRFFLGSTSEETADLLNISKATVDREIKFARGWLYERLQFHAARPDSPV